MSKQSLLLVDGDTRSMRVLEVSLRKAGFTVTTAASVQDALDKLEVHAPDLIISETTFPDGDGFDLRRRVRATPDWAEIPFIFLTAEAAIENKIRGLELGVDDYLTKPIYIKEIVTRINILLQKRQRVRFEERRDGRTRFAGRVADMPVVDVIQTIEISRKSGVIQFVGDRNRQAAIYFRDGRVIDAEAGALQGEDAVYRLLTWNEGEFEVVFRTVRRREVIQTSSQGLLMEGMRRLDEWSRLLEQLPPLTHRFEVDVGELSLRLGDVPDDNNPILRLIDGKRTLLEVIDASDVGDLEVLQAISRLYFEELLMDLDHGAPVRQPTGKPVPLVEVEAPTPIEDAASGPIPDADTLVPAPEVHEDQVLSEDLAPGALLGGYRPSSLRLIDEAVAAAQAIEPSMFEDDESPPAPGRGRQLGDVEEAPASSSNGVHATLHDASAENSGVPREIEREDSSGRRDDLMRLPRRAPDPIEPPDEDDDDGALPSRPLGSDDSGLRMIGSLGRDRASASGELAPVGAAMPRTETQRELVTILPRRITRELTPVPAPVVKDEPSVQSDDAEPPREPPSETEERVATDEELRPRAPVPAPPVEPPRDAPVARIPASRSGAYAAASGTRVVGGPGPGALALIILAALLGAIALYLRLRRTPHAVEPPRGGAVVDAGVSVAPSEGGASSAIVDAAPLPEAHDAGPRTVAAVDAAPADAPSGPRDAADATAEDPAVKAKQLYDRAHDALDENDAAKALDLVDQSIKLRRTARAFLLRAQALQRLERVDDALSSITAAEKLAPTYSTVFELRGRILWAARRKDEARAEFEKFLKIEPSGPRADQIRHLLEGP